MKLNCMKKPLLAVSLLAISTCKSSNSTTKNSLKEVGVGNSTKVCAAIRGNGHYLMAHFGALARISEHYGSMYAVAGGSSGTVTAFIYESIRMNPLVKGVADPDRGMRTALLLKSVMGYIYDLGDSSEIQSLMYIKDFIDKVQQQKIFELTPDKFQEVANRLLALIDDENISSLINPDVLNDLIQIKNLQHYPQDSAALYQYKIAEISNALKAFGAFDASDKRIFFRNGLVSFDGMAAAFGLVADFYAGRVPPSRNDAKLDDFVNACSSEQVQGGKTWQQVATVRTSKGTCGELFKKAVVAYRSTLGTSPKAVSSRISDTMGAFVPTIIPTAILKGPAAKAAHDKALALYEDGKNIDFPVKFSDVKFGYWYPTSVAAGVEKIKTKFPDEKSQRFVSLSTNAKWRDVLRASPAEPGLSRTVPIDQDTISVGGWGDLAPVQVLKAAGCDQVVYITRRQPESPFLVSQLPINLKQRPPMGVAELLNMEESDRQAIFNIDDPKSGYGSALAEAGAIWCTDWNIFGDFDTEKMMDQAYATEMVVNDDYFIQTPNYYKNVSSEHMVGCHSPLKE